MALDIFKCNVVSPKYADYSYYVHDNKELERIQSTGVICVERERIGRNCLNNDWHKRYNELLSSNWDDIDQVERDKKELNRMLIVFPEQVEEKIKNFLEINQKFGNFFNEPKEFDFLIINW